MGSVTEFNQEPTVDDMYRVRANSAMLIVAVPVKGQETNLEFSYWVQQRKPALQVISYVEDQQPAKQGQDQNQKEEQTEEIDNKAIIVVVTLVAVVLLMFCLGICLVKCREEFSKER